MTVRRIGDLAKIIKQTRKSKGLTQQRLAELTGTGRRFIVELESGRKETLEVGIVLRVLVRLGLNLEVAEKAKSRDGSLA